MDLNTVVAVVKVASAVVLVVTAIILWGQISETRRATYVPAFRQCMITAVRLRN
jgi:hypothetical protein